MSLRIDVRPCKHELGKRKIEAMLAGMRRHGVIKAGGAHPDVALGWAWRGLHPTARRTLVLEKGYVGDRRDWTSAQFDGLNGRGWHPGADDDGARWRRHHGDAMQPWREPGGQYALLIGQCAGDKAVQNLGIRAWYGNVAARALAAHGWPVVFRQHPKVAQQEGPPGIPRLKGDLEAALEGAALVLTLNSNVGVLAALAGVPAVAEDAGSMAWPVASHDASEIVRPERSRWAAHLAWAQWQETELRSGDAWDHLRHGLKAE